MPSARPSSIQALSFRPSALSCVLILLTASLCTAGSAEAKDPCHNWNALQEARAPVLAEYEKLSQELPEQVSTVWDDDKVQMLRTLSECSGSRKKAKMARQARLATAKFELVEGEVWSQKLEGELDFAASEEQARAHFTTAQASVDSLLESGAPRNELQVFRGLKEQLKTRLEKLDQRADKARQAAEAAAAEAAAAEAAAAEAAAEAAAAEAAAAEAAAAEAAAAEAAAAEAAAAAVRPASGISVYNGTGFHFGEPLNEKGGEGRWFNEGGGIGLLLGPPASRLLGRVRFGYNAVIDLAGGTRHVALLSAGVQVELLPDINKRFGLYVVTDVGITPLFADMRLYLFADVGPGVRFDVHRRISLFAEVCALFRYENGFYAGPQFYFGARFALD